MKFLKIEIWLLFLILLLAIYSFIPEEKSVIVSDKKLRVMEELALNYPVFNGDVAEKYKTLYYSTKKKIYYDISYLYLTKALKFDPEDLTSIKNQADYFIYNREFERAEILYAKLFEKDSNYSEQLFYSILWGDNFNKKSRLIIEIINRTDNNQILKDIYKTSEFNENIKYESLKKLLEQNPLSDDEMSEYLKDLLYFADFELFKKHIIRLENLKKRTMLLFEYNYALKNYSYIVKNLADNEFTDLYKDKVFYSLYNLREFDKALDFCIDNKSILKDWDIMSKALSISKLLNTQKYIIMLDILFKEFPQKRQDFIYNIYYANIKNGNYSKALDYIELFIKENKDNTHIYNFLVLSEGKISEKEFDLLFRKLDIEQKRSIYYTIPVIRKKYAPEDIFDDNEIIASFYAESGNLLKTAYFLEKAKKFYEAALIYIQTEDLEHALSLLNMSEIFNKEECKIQRAYIYIQKNNISKFKEEYKHIKKPDLYISWFALDIYKQEKNFLSFDETLDYIEKNFDSEEAEFLVLFNREKYKEIIKRFEITEQKEQYIMFYIESLYNTDIANLRIALEKYRSMISEDNYNYYNYVYYLYKKDYANIYKYAMLNREKSGWYDVMSALVYGNRLKKAYSYLKTVNPDSINKEMIDSYYYMISDLKSKKYSLSYQKESEYIKKTILFLENIGSLDINLYSIEQKSSLEYRNMKKDIISMYYYFNKNAVIELKNNINNNLNPGFTYKWKMRDLQIQTDINILSEEDRQLLNMLTYDSLNISKTINKYDGFINWGFNIKNMKSLGYLYESSLYTEKALNPYADYFISINSYYFENKIDYNDFSDIFVNRVTQQNIVDDFYDNTSNSIGIGIKYTLKKNSYISSIILGLYKNTDSGEFSGNINYILKKWNSFFVDLNLSVNNSSETNFHIKAGKNFE